MPAEREGAVQDVDVLIVGSGPIGATYARRVKEALPGASVLMVELGPQITDPPGRHVLNLPDEGARTKARELSQGPDSGAHEPGLRRGHSGIPVMAEGTITAQQGTFAIHAGGLPAAALSSCVGGMGAHWSCATPRPYGSERIDFIDEAETEAMFVAAEELLLTKHDKSSDSPGGQAIHRVLSGLFDAELPEGRRVGDLPLAEAAGPDGSIVLTGVDTVLGPLAREHDGESGFELRPETLCRQVLVEGDRATGAVLEHLPTGARTEVRARAVVVAADALRTPQLLWASGVRPEALGRYLTEHPMTFTVVELDDAVIPPMSEEQLAEAAGGGLPIELSAAWVPFSDPGHPYQGQLGHMNICPFPADPEDLGEGRAGYAALGWLCRKEPRAEDRIAFSDDEVDWCGMPAMEIAYELGERDRVEVERALELTRQAGAALGRAVPGAEARLMPAGSSLHYQGTVRMGPADDGTSVCDSRSRVWGFSNLYVGGNGLIPTATACNPTLTSVALAIRGAEALVGEVLAGSDLHETPRT